jgi:DNA primase
VIVNYDPDPAGQAAAERSISLLLEQDFEVRVLALPAVGEKKADPDLFIREKGSGAYMQALKKAPPYIEYLIGRTREMDLTTGQGKLRALNFLMPYVQKIPNRLLRTEWAKIIAEHLHIEEPVLRAALSKAALDRRSEIRTQPELVRRNIQGSDLIRMLLEATEFRRELAKQLQSEHLYDGLETEKIFTVLVVAALSDGATDVTEITALLGEREREVLREIQFEPEVKFKWTDAQDCLQILRLRKARLEMDALRAELERLTSGSGIVSPEAQKIHHRKVELAKTIECLKTEIEDRKYQKEEDRDAVLDDLDRKIRESLRRL